MIRHLTLLPLLPALGVATLSDLSIFAPVSLVAPVQQLAATQAAPPQSAPVAAATTQAEVVRDLHGAVLGFPAAPKDPAAVAPTAVAIAAVVQAVVAPPEVAPAAVAPVPAAAVVPAPVATAPVAAAPVAAAPVAAAPVAAAPVPAAAVVPAPVATAPVAAAPVAAAPAVTKDMLVDEATANAAIASNVASNVAMLWAPAARNPQQSTMQEPAQVNQRQQLLPQSQPQALQPQLAAQAQPPAVPVAQQPAAIQRHAPLPALQPSATQQTADIAATPANTMVPAQRQEGASAVAVTATSAATNAAVEAAFASAAQANAATSVANAAVEAAHTAASAAASAKIAATAATAADANVAAPRVANSGPSRGAEVTKAAPARVVTVAANMASNAAASASISANSAVSQANSAAASASTAANAAAVAGVPAPVPQESAAPVVATLTIGAPVDAAPLAATPAIAAPVAVAPVAAAPAKATAPAVVLRMAPEPLSSAWSMPQYYMRRGYALLAGLSFAMFVKALCVAGNVLVQISPFPSVKRWELRGCTGEADAAPYVSIAFGGCQWCFYGLFAWLVTSRSGFLILVISNCLGAVLGTYYVFTFFRNCRNEEFLRTLQKYLSAVTALALLQVCALGYLPPERALFLIGIISSFCGFINATSVLVTVPVVLRTKNSRSIPGPYAVANLMSAMVWSLCGFMLADPCVTMPNLFATWCAAASLVLKVMYPSIEDDDKMMSVEEGQKDMDFAAAKKAHKKAIALHEFTHLSTPTAFKANAGTFVQAAGTGHCGGDGTGGTF